MKADPVRKLLRKVVADVLDLLDALEDEQGERCRYATRGGRAIPFFSRDEIMARGQIPVRKLVVGEVYWHTPGDALFIVNRCGPSCIEGVLDLGRWRNWVIEQPGETCLYPVSNIEREILKNKIEEGATIT